MRIRAYIQALPCFFIYVQVLYSRSKTDVVSHCHMSEQRIALEHHADLPMLDWNMRCILVCRTARQGTAECLLYTRRM